MSRRPDPTTMRGMIWNANHVLDQALDPKTNGIPRSLFTAGLKGIILISVVEAGFGFSGTVGSGILLARTGEESWSKPVALGMAGVGWGFVAGASLKDVMIFIFDDATLNSIAGDAGLKFGGQAEVTAGTFGRNAQLDLNLTNKGIGSTFAVSFSKGLFGGISIEGALMGPRSAQNAHFYGKEFTPTQILFDDMIVCTPPEDTLLPDVYEKLNKLAAGKIDSLSPEDAAKVEQARIDAVQEGEAAAQQSDEIVKVDAAAEAAKEAAAGN